MANAWSHDVYRSIKEKGLTLAATVPDGGLTGLLKLLAADSTVRVVTLATEEEGVALLCGAWVGGSTGVLLMQSSGVGNCINMLSLPGQCRIPLIALVTMRGGKNEANPWQVPMGRAVEDVFKAMSVRTFPVTNASDVGATFRRAVDHALSKHEQSAVLVSQEIIGAKNFKGG